MKRLLVLFLFVALQTKPMDWLSIGKGVVQSTTSESNSGSSFGALALKTGAFAAATIGSAILWETVKDPLEREVRKRLGWPVAQSPDQKIQALLTQLEIMQAQLTYLRGSRIENGQATGLAASDPTAGIRMSRIGDLAVSFAPGSPMLGNQRPTEIYEEFQTEQTKQVSDSSSNHSEQEVSSDSSDGDWNAPSFPSSFSSGHNSESEDPEGPIDSDEKREAQAVFEGFVQEASKTAGRSSSSSDEGDDKEKALETAIREGIKQRLANHRRSASNPSLTTLAKHK